MRTILAGICIFVTTLAFAQRECAGFAYTNLQKSIDPSFANRVYESELFITRQIAAKTNGPDAPKVITIPVVVHVLYKTAAQNISDEQVISQIDALNRDFRRNNADTVNTPLPFRSLGADAQIEFALATVDPKGRATDGIVRKATSVSYWSMDDKIRFSAQGGSDAWDTRYYLNIWVGDMGSVLGYSSIPGAPVEKDGVVIHYSAFGTINTAAPYHLGRTGTHEVGHWLGLKHIWGDSYCGDDSVDDTPKQGNFTPGCPTAVRSSCDNGEAGDMYMNFMDFTDDDCMNLFTAGQKQRMLLHFNSGGPRHFLLTSKGLGVPWEEGPLPDEAGITTAIKVYPNPARSEIVLDFENNESWIGRTISIININGVVVLKTQINSKLQKVNLSRLNAGIYFIQGENGKERIREKFVRL